MHGIKPTFALTAALALLVAGCEWSGTSDSNSWNGAYDAMNFSGTYRTVTKQSSTSTSTTTTTTSDSSGSGGTTEVQYSATETKWKTSNSQLNYSNLQTSHPNIVPGSVQVSLGGQTAFKDDGQGNLVSVSSSDMGSGSVSYEAGTVAFRILVPVGVVDITISYSYIESESIGGKSSEVSTSTTTTTTGTKVTAITVSQSGQNLTMRLNNGIVMSGRFTTVQQTGKINEDTNAGYNTYNAQFEVASGKESRLVGSLNYDLSSGYRTLNGTWTWGKNTYDVQAVGPSWLKSAETSLNYGAVSEE